MFQDILHLNPVLFTFLVIFITTFAFVGGMLFTRKYFSHLFFKPEDNQVANILMRQIGTLLSVLLAFAVISTWQDYELQRRNTAEEASTMGNLYRDCRGMDIEKEKEIQSLLKNYTKAVVEDGWPKMKELQESKLSWMAFNKLYGTIVRYMPTNLREQIIDARMIQHLNDMAKFRRLRHLRNADPLIPDILWVSIYCSTILFTICSYFLRSQNVKLQTIITIISAILFGVVFSMLLLFNHPYSGSLQISPTPIENLLKDVYPIADITEKLY
jgi:hypothetical protein